MKTHHNSSKTRPEPGRKYRPHSGSAYKANFKGGRGIYIKCFLLPSTHFSFKPELVWELEEILVYVVIVMLTIASLL